MLTRFTKTIRWRAAVTLALAYVLCVLVPPVAHAFSGSWAATHLATSHHHDAASALVHDAKAPVQTDGAAHRHGTHDDTTGNGADGHDQAGGCCTYFCVSAAPAAAMPDVTPVLVLDKTSTPANHRIAGRGPDRLDRPPIVLLPH